MLFNSLRFALFLPIVFTVYWVLPYRFRWFLILASSYFFYMCWNPKYVFLIIATTLISYGAAVLLEKTSVISHRRWILIISFLVCFGVLFFFKYFNFASLTISAILDRFSVRTDPIILNLVLPVGISFYTFQTISYVLDVYRGDISAERHLGYYAAYISFFPQLVAGPIERASNVIPQIREERSFDYDNATYGLKLMAIGYFKKIIIADTLSGYVSTIYDSPQKYSGFCLVLATLFFTIQIYCDFSGYSDIAIGVAKLFNINLMKNFNSPYFSQSIGEFWRRWHISLSTWFKDYVYIPLGGNRVSRFRHSINLIITFLLSGLWHGADWSFVIWGLVHGLAQTIETAFSNKRSDTRKGLITIFKTVFVFLFCAFAWIFFVSKNTEDAIYVLTHFLTGIGSFTSYISQGYADIGLDKKAILFSGISIILLTTYDYASLKNDVIQYISGKKLIYRWIIYCSFVMWVIINLPANYSSEFIYFQF